MIVNYPGIWCPVWRRFHNSADDIAYAECAMRENRLKSYVTMLQYRYAERLIWC